MSEEKKTGTRIPLWLAIVITVGLSIPFTFHLGKYNLPLWVSFIVWAEYFALGANPSALKLIIPSFPYGCCLVGLWLTTTQLLTPLMGVEVALIVCNVIWIGVGVAVMVTNKTLNAGSLALFNGLSMTLAVHFTGTIPAIGATNPYAIIWLAVIWTVIAGYFGAFLGWLNITIMFPYEK